MRNGDRQTLSVVRHFVSETQDGREVKRCKWGRGKRQQLTGKKRRRINSVSRGQRLTRIISGEKKVRIRVRVGVRIRSRVRVKDSKRVRVEKARR